MALTSFRSDGFASPTFDGFAFFRLLNQKIEKYDYGMIAIRSPVLRYSTPETWVRQARRFGHYGTVMLGSMAITSHYITLHRITRPN
jgi:hypothetical protein